MVTLGVHPDEFFSTRVCLAEISKNLTGGLYLLDHDDQTCRERDCQTLKTSHALRAGVESNPPCDSELGQSLDGRFVVRNLVTAFTDGKSKRRGVHVGNFRWLGKGAQAQGQLSGLSNAGTHRKPIFRDCEPCDAVGYLQGCFRGRVIEAEDRSLLGCDIYGTYRLQVSSWEDAKLVKVKGTIEGSFVCPCRAGGCTEFRSFSPGSHPNPWLLGGHSYTVHDHAGALAPTAQIATWGSHTGLNCGHRLNVQLGTPASQVELTLAHFAQPASAEALSGGAVVAAGSMTAPQDTPETIVLTAPSIDAIVVEAPSNETLLLELCTDRRVQR
jgi:hypothetical protein